LARILPWKYDFGATFRARTQVFPSSVVRQFQALTNSLFWLDANLLTAALLRRSVIVVALMPSGP
jgi:hypothetical protein